MYKYGSRSMDLLKFLKLIWFNLRNSCNVHYINPTLVYTHIILPQSVSLNALLYNVMTIMLMEKVVKWNWRHEDKNGIKVAKGISNFKHMLTICSFVSSSLTR